MDMSQLLHPGFVSGINSLEILHLLSSPHYHYPSVYGEEDPMQANMRQLFSIGLKTVTITFLTGMNTTNMYLFKVIPRNSQTLTAITLNNFGIYGLDLLEKEHEVIPHLRRVTLQKVDNKVESVHGLVTWLESEPPLTQLDIHFGFKASTKFLKYLERSFRTESLKTLSLSAIYLQTAREWSWLERCNKLKEFGIVQEHFSSLGNWEMKATGVSFLPWLPKGLKKLRLRGMKGFWKDQADLGGDDIAEVEIVALLSRFPGLTHLDLTGCRGAVTDVMVQSIIGQMRKLEMLKLSHGSCTDFAVTGKENGVSLKELKDLRHLKIENCPGISVEGLLMSVRHAFLQTVEVPDVQITDDQMEKLVAQNPALHSLLFKADEGNGCILVTKRAKKMKMTENLRELDLASI